jgi:hypothetical protein
MGTYEEAVQEIRRVLEKTASNRGTVAYSEVVAQVSAMHLEPDSKLFAEMLDQISRQADGEGLGMLSAVVIHKGDPDLASSSSVANWVATPPTRSPFIVLSSSGSTTPSPTNQTQQNAHSWRPIWWPRSPDRRSGLHHHWIAIRATLARPRRTPTTVRPISIGSEASIGWGPPSRASSWRARTVP